MAILRVDEKTIAPLHFARETYLRRLEEVNLLPIFVSSLESRSAVDEKYEICDGVLAMGGTDVDPEHYGQAPHLKTRFAEPSRDTLELYVTRRALRERKPYLGICRGCQILAVADGGSLIQDVPEWLARSGRGAGEKHGLAEAATYDWLPQNEKHEVRGSLTSRFGGLISRYGNASAIANGSDFCVKVNSAHHQAVADPGPHFVVSATSPAGINEVMEHRDSSFFCYGLQCHPEVPGESLGWIFRVFADAVSG
jgi:putative glutamine amidotransferase